MGNQAGLKECPIYVGEFTGGGCQNVVWVCSRAQTDLFLCGRKSAAHLKGQHI